MKYCTLSLCRLGTSFRGSAAAWESLAAVIPGKLPSFLKLFLHYLRKIKTKLSHNLSCFSALLKKKKKGICGKVPREFFS